MIADGDMFCLMADLVDDKEWTGMAVRRSLLGIFAHPDDESFGPGGTLARYAAEGAEVHVIIATDGIAGSVESPGQVKDHETLAQVRSAELANAAVALGITSIWSLPYRDSGMRGAPDNEHPDALIQQPVEQLTEEVMEYIERFQPQVIVTHDPFGGYGHPDHVRVYEATTAAFQRVQQSHVGSGGYRGPQKLYYTAFDKRFLKVMVQLMPWMGQDPMAVGRNKDINLVEISQWETPVHARVDVSRYLPQKLAASQAHASQYSGGPTFIRVLPSFLRRRFMGMDTFTRAYPAPNGSIERDLFAGVA
jgi:LmbE family N-acetylglucosaminyl deacetylase